MLHPSDRGTALARHRAPPAASPPAAAPAEPRAAPARPVAPAEPRARALGDALAALRAHQEALGAWRRELVRRAAVERVVSAELRATCAESRRTAAMLAAECRVLLEASHEQAMRCRSGRAAPWSVRDAPREGAR